MSITRYNKRSIITNSSEDYMFSDMFKKRGIKRGVQQFSTPDLSSNGGDYSNVSTVSVTWSIGTKYFNLAKQYYGDEEYWWIIAWYNLRPLETDFKPGEIVLVPVPLEAILSAYGVI